MMSKLYGYAGKLLRINLTKEEITEEKRPPLKNESPGFRAND
jgi:hypothetical protein